MAMMHSSPSRSEPKPFTGRTVLFWLLGFFAVIFAANAVFIWLALGSFPGVVVESSYQAGQDYNQEIANARAQAERNWQVEADLSRSQDGSGFLKVQARDRTGAPLTGLSFMARLQNPTHDGSDVEVVLREGESGLYTGRASGLSAGNWNVVIEAEGADKRLFRSESRIFLKE